MYPSKSGKSSWEVLAENQLRSLGTPVFLGFTARAFPYAPCGSLREYRRISQGGQHGVAWYKVLENKVYYMVEPHEPR